MAAPIYNLHRGFFAYTSDDTNVYEVATTLENGTLNGASPIAPGTDPTYPRGWKMRKVLAEFVDSGKVYRTSVPVFSPSNTLWTSGAVSFSKGGQTFTTTGRIGERRTYKGG